jgi:hypothetical protein
MNEVFVKLRENLRVLDDYDTDFTIKVGEEKELPERVMRSIVIRNMLWKGELILTKGSVAFPLKMGAIEIVGGSNIATLQEDGKTFKKDLLTGNFLPDVTVIQDTAVKAVEVKKKNKR